MTDPQLNLAERVLETAWNHLREWEIGSPLDVACELDSDGVLCLSNKPVFRGYANWARRMEDLNMEELPKRAATHDESGWHMRVDYSRSNRLDDSAEIRSIISAVDYIALMENVVVSIGLMMTYLPLNGKAAPQLFCLHRYDALQRLVSATDRLRTLSLYGLFGLSDDEAQDFCRCARTGKYQAAFKIVGRKLDVDSTPLRKMPAGRTEFETVYDQMWPFVQNSKAAIRKLRSKRNIATHVLGSQPGVALKKRSLAASLLSVPYLPGTYRTFGHGIPDREQFYGELEDLKRDYEQVLRFGSLIFELDNIIQVGSK